MIVYEISGMGCEPSAETSNIVNSLIHIALKWARENNLSNPDRATVLPEGTASYQWEDQDGAGSSYIYAWVLVAPDGAIKDSYPSGCDWEDLSPMTPAIDWEWHGSGPYVWATDLPEFHPMSYGRYVWHSTMVLPSLASRRHTK